MLPEKRYLLILFIVGIVIKRVVKDYAGTNASIMLILLLGMMYWWRQHRNNFQTNEIRKLERETTAKLKALYNEQGLPAEEIMKTRPTHFQLLPRDAALITDRMHIHSRKLSGSRSERRKFLQKRQNESQAIDDKSDTTLTQKPDLERVIEEAVNATM
uniref:Uncharacterized protein AlNc14C1G31 n=1 Tax=Albugo laibachii Nc14 TaxID=890382 RepID=F0VYM8_9STRA|nr:conserved hypothetical protein [Albugo laibachii Nc14]|eukprot:CCA13892.1 conserved hypothetical protein [Albugo laibachii Nc14]